MQLGSRWASCSKKAAEMQECIAHPPEKNRLALQKPLRYINHSLPNEEHMNNFLKSEERYYKVNFFSFFNLFLPVQTLAQETWTTVV